MHLRRKSLDKTSLKLDIAELRKKLALLKQGKLISGAQKPKKR